MRRAEQSVSMVGDLGGSQHFLGLGFRVQALNPKLSETLGICRDFMGCGGPHWGFFGLLVM